MQLVQAVRDLLRLFGLCMASFEVFHPERGVQGLDDLCAIALLLQTSESHGCFATTNSVSTLDSLGMDGLMGSSACHLASKALVLSADADFRFSRLITTYNLRVEDPTGGNAMISCMTKDDGEGRGNAGLAKSEEPPMLKPDQPRWMLWTCADTEW